MTVFQFVSKDPRIIGSHNIYLIVNSFLFRYGIIIAVMEGCAATAVQLENEFVQDVGEMTEGSLADTASPWLVLCEF